MPNMMARLRRSRRSSRSSFMKTILRISGRKRHPPDQTEECIVEIGGAGGAAKLGNGAAGEHPAVAHDADAVANVLGLTEAVGGEQNALAGLGELTDGLF